MRALPILTLLVVVQGFAAQTGEPPWVTRLSAPVESFSLSANGLRDALVNAARQLHIPLGIEWVKTSDTGKPFSRTWRATTAERILLDIVKAYPGYSATYSQVAAFEVAPASLAGDKRDLLNYEMAQFAVDGETVNEASADLSCRMSPIVEPPAAGSHFAGCAESILASSADRSMTFTVNNAVVRHILDRLLLESGRTAWVVTYPAELAKSAGGFLKTLQPGSDVPADGRFFRPFWDFVP